MSTVLWANRLSNGVVKSDEADKSALFKHLSKLDTLCEECGVTLLSQMCDYTDMRLNVDDVELPDGMASTDELMAQSGVWVEAHMASAALRSLIQKIHQDNTRFGLLRNEQARVVEELEESKKFAEAAAAEGENFNFSVVM